MGRRFLKVASILLVFVSLVCAASIYLAIRNPEKVAFKPLPYVYAGDKSSDDLKNANPNTKPTETATPAATPAAPVSNAPATTPSSKKDAPNATKANKGENANSIIIDVPMVYQYPEYPTGCEPVAATMLLNFYGYNISKTDFVNKMPKGQFPYIGDDGNRYGPDPNSVFVGNPKSPSSWGIYAPALNKVINTFLKDSNLKDSKSLTAVNITGSSIDDLTSLIDKGIPVLAWGTIDMSKPFKGDSWYINGKISSDKPNVSSDMTLEEAIDNFNRGVIANSKTLFTWIRREHSLVLVGYDQNNFIFNDPIRGVVRYSKGAFEASYNALGKQAIYIKKV